MARVKAPRAAFIDFPLGRPCGPPNDPALQTRILRDVLGLLETANDPGTLVDLDHQWSRPFGWRDYMTGVKEMIDEEGQKIQQWKPGT